MDPCPRSGSLESLKFYPPTHAGHAIAQSHQGRADGRCEIDVDCLCAVLEVTLHLMHLSESTEGIVSKAAPAFPDHFSLTLWFPDYIYLPVYYNLACLQKVIQS